MKGFASRYLRIVGMALLLFALPGAMCLGSTPQGATPDDFATIAQAGLPLLVKTYQEEQLAAVRAAAAEEQRRAVAAGRAADLNAAMEEAKRAVRARWRPLWGDDPAADAGARELGLWTLFVNAHALWVTSIESGTNQAGVVRVRALVVDAYCKMIAVVPQAASVLLQPPGVSCSMAPASVIVIDAGTDGSR
jgi:hypothetical protein